MALTRIKGTSIVDDSISSSKIIDNSITSSKIVDNSITNSKIVDDSITSSKIVDNSITNSKIVDDSITSPKIVDNSISSSKIIDNSITNSKIVDDSISSSKIIDNSITSPKIVDDSINDDKITGGGIAPTGTILSFASEVAPTGWLICDGSIVSRTTYADLYSAIGDRWGNGDGSSTFHLPDLRGRFLRGHDGGAGRDPDAAGRSAMNVGGASGDNVGSTQGGATSRPNSSFSGPLDGLAETAGNHTHDIQLNSTNGGAGTSAPYSSVASWTYVNNDDIRGSGDHTHNVTGTTTIDSGGDNETRPINANVSYIIKI